MQRVHRIRTILDTCCMCPVLTRLNFVLCCSAVLNEPEGVSRHLRLYKASISPAALHQLWQLQAGVTVECLRCACLHAMSS
jgi:hypothetical protein